MSGLKAVDEEINLRRLESRDGQIKIQLQVIQIGELKGEKEQIYKAPTFREPTFRMPHCGGVIYQTQTYGGTKLFGANLTGANLSNTLLQGGVFIEGVDLTKTIGLK